jgi:hypothetical protein
LRAAVKLVALLFDRICLLLRAMSKRLRKLKINLDKYISLITL